MASDARDNATLLDLKNSKTTLIQIPFFGAYVSDSQLIHHGVHGCYRQIDSAQPARQTTHPYLRFSWRWHWNIKFKGNAEFP